MPAQTSSTLAKSIPAEHAVPLADLNLETFSDPDLAEDAAADCVKLLQASQEDFEAVRSQKWYKRLWTQLVQGDTRRRVDGLRSISEAQALLVQILKAHFEYTARVSVLATYIAAGLNQAAPSGNQYTRLVIDIGEQHENLVREIEQNRARGTHDPSNEYTWTEEHRLLLFKVMVAAAAIDGHIVDRERQLLEFKLQDLDLGDKARSEAERYLDRVTPLHGEVREIQSPQVRMVLFRHAAAVVLADGEYNLSEKYYIRDLARALQIAPDETEAVFKDLDREGARLSPERIAELASLGQKARDTSVQASSAATPRTAPDRQRALEAALAELEPRLRQWTGVFMDWAHYELVSFLAQRQERINQAFDEDSSLEETLNIFEDVFNADEMDNDFSDSRKEAEKVVTSAGRCLADEADIILGGGLFKIIASEFNDISACSVDPGSAVERLLAKVAEVRQNVPTPLLGGIKCGAICAACVFLLGPLGWLAGAAGAWFSHQLDGDKIESMVKSLGQAHDRVLEAASRWDKKAAKSLLFLGDQIAEALLDSMRVKGCLETIRRAEERVEADLAEWAAPEEDG